ncbi:extracellular solute-binding protein [Dictyobacter kobayashii]|uniref:Sugar ABC transporter substrate-binding protein n=1 Tax=Dictyobacter kobayashii TaxID=2014872 RepID=A0A402ATR0_9CHLR|nr:extracellular solute-binding protein [Dictyobacter kobayashii]GCE22502.1 sugar ABC transporter substrate-binding protein [Dictyobacter kobayashii]
MSTGDALDVRTSMMSRRRFLDHAGKTAVTLGSATALGGAILTACGTAASSGTTLSLWNFDPAPQAVGIQYQKWIDEYKKVNPKVSFKLQGFASDHDTKLAAAAKVGQGPDLDQFDPASLYSYYKSGYIVPFPDALFPIDTLKKDYPWLPLQLLPDGRMYMFPMDVATGIIIYDKKAWRAAGLTDNDAPKTWDDCAQLGKHLTLSTNGVVKQYGFNMGGYPGDWLVLDLYYQLGGYLYTEDGNQVNFNNEQMIQAIQTYADFANKYKVGSYQDDPAALMGQGRNAMFRGWGWGINAAQSANPQAEIGAFPLPTYTGKRDGVSGHGVLATMFAVMKSASNERRDAAFQFLQWLFLKSDPVRHNLELATLDGGVPQYGPSVTLANAPAVNAMKVVVNNAIYPGQYPDGVATPLQRAIQQIARTHANPADALSAAEQSANKYLASLGSDFGKLVTERKKIQP